MPRQYNRDGITAHAIHQYNFRFPYLNSYKIWLIHWRYHYHCIWNTSEYILKPKEWQFDSKKYCDYIFMLPSQEKVNLLHVFSMLRKILPLHFHNSYICRFHRNNENNFHNQVTDFRSMCPQSNAVPRKMYILNSFYLF